MVINRKKEIRKIIDENDGWIFEKEREEVKSESAEGTMVSLPHTWNAQDGSDGGKNGIPDYDRTRGRYTKTMHIDYAYIGKELYLEFGAAGMSCELYVNDVHVPYADGIYGGGIEYAHKGGFGRFRFNITDYVSYGEDNAVTVLADNTRVPEIAPLNGDFNCQGGLYRGAKLVVTDSIHFDMSDYGSDGVYG